MAAPSRAPRPLLWPVEGGSRGAAAAGCVTAWCVVCGVWWTAPLLHTLSTDCLLKTCADMGYIICHMSYMQERGAR
jgi:hypothetical protein